MDIWILIKNAILLLFFLVTLSRPENHIPQVFHPDPSLPKELNEFLLEVQNHKNDFRCIRDIASKSFKTRNAAYYSKQLLEHQEKRRALKRSNAEEYDRPTNDIYPYMYRKNAGALDVDQKNRNSMNRYRRQLNSNENLIKIQPNSISGVLHHDDDLMGAEEKYPDRIVDYKRDVYSDLIADSTSTSAPNPYMYKPYHYNLLDQKGKEEEDEKTEKTEENEDDQMFDKLKTIYGTLSNKKTKRDLEIDVRNDGKLVKEIHEDSKAPKSIVLNFNPVKSPIHLLPNFNYFKSDDLFTTTALSFIDGPVQGFEGANEKFVVPQAAYPEVDARPELIRDNTMQKVKTYDEPQSMVYNNVIKKQPMSHPSRDGFEEVKSVVLDQPEEKSKQPVKKHNQKMDQKRNMDDFNKNNDVMHDYSNDHLYSYKQNEEGKEKDGEFEDEQKATKEKKNRVKKHVKESQATSNYIKHFGGNRRVRQKVQESITKRAIATKAEYNFDYKLDPFTEPPNCDKNELKSLSLDYRNEKPETIWTKKNEMKLADNDRVMLKPRSVDNKYSNKFRAYSKIIQANKMQNQKEKRFASRKLKEIVDFPSFDADEDTYDYGNVDNQNYYPTKNSVRLKTQAAEGDYGDEEDSYSAKEKTKKFNIVKKTQNEFANPRTTSTEGKNEEEYDYGDKTTKVAIKNGNTEKAYVKKVKENDEDEELYESKRNLIDDDLVAFARHPHNKKLKNQKVIHMKGKASARRTEPMLKQKFYRYNQAAADKVKRNEGPVRVLPEDAEQGKDQIEKRSLPLDNGNVLKLYSNLLSQEKGNPLKNKGIVENDKFLVPNSFALKQKNKRCGDRDCANTTFEDISTDFMPIDFNPVTPAPTVCDSSDFSDSNRNVEGLLSGKVPMKIVDNMYCNVKKNVQFNRRFHHGLSREHNYTRDESENNSSIETGRLIDSIGSIINKFLEDTTTCLQLSSTLQSYLYSIIKVQKQKASSDNEHCNFDNHQNTMLFHQQNEEALTDTNANHNDNNNNNNSNGGSGESSCSSTNIKEKIRALNVLLDKYNRMSKHCQDHARLVKEYIVNHLRMLSGMLKGIQPTCHDGTCQQGEGINNLLPEGVSESNPMVEEQLESVGLGKKHEFQPNFDLNALVENEIKNEPVAFTASNVNVQKRKVNFAVTQTAKYKKLLDAVNQVRQRRDSEGKIGMMFGKQEDDDGKVEFESPLVYSL